MSRDHTKLRVFEIADSLVIQVYRATESFPVIERFGLQSQIRRAAVSSAANIVEGCARRTTSEYVNVLSIGLGSASEARYLVDVALRLKYLPRLGGMQIVGRYTELVKGLQKLIGSLR